MRRLVTHVDFKIDVYRCRVFDIDIHAHPRFTQLYDIETVLHVPSYSYNDILITPFRQVEYIEDPFTSSKQDTPSFFEALTVKDKEIVESVYIGSDLKAMEPISERWHKPVGRFHTIHTASDSYSMPYSDDLFYTLLVDDYHLLKFVANYEESFWLTVLKSDVAQTVPKFDHSQIDKLFSFSEDEILLYQRRVDGVQNNTVNSSHRYLLFGYSAVLKLPLRRSYNFGTIGGGSNCGDELIEVYVDNQLVFSSYDANNQNEWSADIPLSEGFHSLVILKLRDTTKIGEKTLRFKITDQPDYEVSVSGLAQMSVEVYAPTTFTAIEDLKQFILNPMISVNLFALLLSEYTPVTTIVKPESSALHDYEKLTFLFPADTISVENGHVHAGQGVNPTITYGGLPLTLQPNVQLPATSVADKILFIRYKGTSGHPSDHNGLLNDYDVSTVYYTGTRTDINTGNYGDYYDMFFCCYLQVEDEGTWQFAVDGDDAVEVEVDGQVVAGWYGGHGTCGCQDHNGSVSLSKGIHQLIFRHEEDVGGDWARLYFKSPSMSSWQIFSIENLAGKAKCFTLQPTQSQIKSHNFISMGCNVLPRDTKTQPVTLNFGFNNPVPFNLLIFDDTESEQKFEYVVLKLYDGVGERINPKLLQLDQQSFNVSAVSTTPETIFIYRRDNSKPMQVVFKSTFKTSAITADFYLQYPLSLYISIGVVNYSNFRLVDSAGTVHPVKEGNFSLATHYDDISAVPEVYHHRQLPRDIKTGTDYVIFGLQQGIGEVDVNILGTAFDIYNRDKIADKSFHYLATHNVYSNRYQFNIFNDFEKQHLLPWCYVGYDTQNDKITTTDFSALTISVSNMSDTDLSGVFVFSVPHVAHSWQGQVEGNTVPVVGINHIATTKYQKDEILFLRYAADHGSTDNHQQMIDSFIYTNLEYKGLTDVINKGNYGDYYHMMFVTWMYVKTSGTWTFQIEGDDRSELEIDGVVFFNDACCTWKSTTYNLSEGWHKLIVRHKEWAGGDYVHLQVKPPGVSNWMDFSVSNLTNYADCYAYIPDDSVLETKSFIINGLAEQPEFTEYVSDLPDWKTNLIGIQMQLPASSSKVVNLASGDFSAVSAITEGLVAFDKYSYDLDTYDSSIVVVNAGETPAKSTRTLFMMDDDSTQVDTSLELDRSNIALFKYTLLSEVGRFPTEIILDVSSFSHMYGEHVPFQVFDVSKNVARSYLYLDEVANLTVTKSLWNRKTVLLRLTAGTIIDEALQDYYKQGYTGYYILRFDNPVAYTVLRLTSSNFDFTSVSADGETLLVLDKNFENPAYYSIEKWDANNQEAILTVVFRAPCDVCYLIVGKT